MVDSKDVAYGSIITLIGITALILWKTMLGNTRYVAENIKEDDIRNPTDTDVINENALEQPEDQDPGRDAAVMNAGSKKTKGTKRTKRKRTKRKRQ